MILPRYILTRFFANVFLINIGFTLLFNLIEFFEKMVRVQQTTTETILYFILLNLVPSFFENLPVASWLGSCMTIMQMEQQNEWEILQLLNIKLNKVFRLILIAGIALSIVSFVGKELITETMAKRAQQFKFAQFKQNRHKKLFNQWFALNHNRFSHFGYLDLQTNTGESLSIIELSPQFKIKKITFAPQIFSDRSKKWI